MALMSMGALVNYGVYALLLLNYSAQHRWPAPAVAAGAVLAALVNFSTARRMHFRHPEASS